jgi:hypothetical protein
MRPHKTDGPSRPNYPLGTADEVMGGPTPTQHTQDAAVYINCIKGFVFAFRTPLRGKSPRIDWHLAAKRPAVYLVRAVGVVCTASASLKEMRRRFSSSQSVRLVDLRLSHNVIRPIV